MCFCTGFLSRRFPFLSFSWSNPLESVILCRWQADAQTNGFHYEHIPAFISPLPLKLLVCEQE